MFTMTTGLIAILICILQFTSRLQASTISRTGRENSTLEARGPNEYADVQYAYGGSNPNHAGHSGVCFGKHIERADVGDWTCESALQDLLKIKKWEPRPVPKSQTSPNGIPKWSLALIRDEESMCELSIFARADPAPPPVFFKPLDVVLELRYMIRYCEWQEMHHHGGTAVMATVHQYRHQPPWIVSLSRKKKWF